MFKRLIQALRTWKTAPVQLSPDEQELVELSRLAQPGAVKTARAILAQSVQFRRSR